MMATATKDMIPATKKQLWYLHLLTGQDTRDMGNLTMAQVSMLIDIAKGEKAKQRLSTITDRIALNPGPASSPNYNNDPDVIIADFTEIPESDLSETSMTVYATGGLANRDAFKPDRKLQSYRTGNVQYIAYNVFGIYIDHTWGRWCIDTARRMQNPDYQREIANQVLNVKQIAEINI